MYKTNPLLIERCRYLRRKGFTLGDIIKAVKIPKTTAYDHIRDILLPVEILDKIINLVLLKRNFFKMEIQ